MTYFDWGVHFRKEAWQFAQRGFWVCRFQKSQETRRHSNGYRPKLEIKDGRHQNTLPPIHQLKVLRLRRYWCLILCFWGQGIQYTTCETSQHTYSWLKFNKMLEHNTDLSQHFSVYYRHGHESERSQSLASQIRLDENIRCSKRSGVTYSIKTIIISSLRQCVTCSARVTL